MAEALLANDFYVGSLRSTWVVGETSLQVDAIPSNLPTLITASHKQPNMTKFRVSGVSGDSPSNYALTGVTVVSGGAENLPEGTPLSCIEHEDFFNQYAEVVNDDLLRLSDRDSDPDNPAVGKVLFYIKDGVPYYVNSDGTTVQLGFSSNEWIDVADSATMDFDLSEGVKRLKFLTGALGGNRTFTLDNGSEGMVFMIRVVQDSTGGRTVTWFGVDPHTVTITIANPGVITTSLDMKTGTPVIFTSTGDLPTGITSGTTYYWIRTGATTGNIATSKTNALAGTTITTSSTQSGTHTMSPQIIWAGGTPPTLTTSKFAWDDFGFIYHSPGQISGIVMAQDM